MKRSLLPLLVVFLLGCGIEPMGTASVRADALAPLHLEMPSEPVFIGGYVHIDVTLPVGLDIEDLEFVVSSGGGHVSVSPERSRQTPTILLAAGRKVGPHSIEVYDGTHTLLGSFFFDVTDSWLAEDAGPPVWIGGGPTPEISAGAWSPGSRGLENLDTYAVSGDYPLAIVFVETTDSQYSSQELQDAINDWDSAAKVLVDYMEEVSGGKLKVQPKVFEKAVPLSGSFDEYFDSNGHIIGSFFRTAANTALEAGVPLEEFKSAAFISRSIDSSTFAWPMASVGRWVTIVVSSDPDKPVALGGISMPHNWPDVDSAKRRIEATLSHELFHNLRLLDMYHPAHQNVGGWDIMHRDANLPHLSIAHKMMLGWAKDVLPLNHGDSDKVTLHPAAQATAPAGRKVGIQFKIADAVNYYFEYRSEAAATVGDQSLPSPNAVLGTEVFTYNHQQPIKAPWVHLLAASPLGQQPFLTTVGQRWFEQSTQSTPPSEKSVTLDAIQAGSHAKVTAEYGPINRADPAITPSSRATRWKSKDILITNARSDADPAWEDAIFLGAENTVSATIHNYGGADDEE